MITGSTPRSCGEIIGFQRVLIAVDVDGTDPKLLGQPESSYDACIRQFDASVIDWLPGRTGKILMERAYVPGGI